MIGGPGELFAQTALDIRAGHPRDRTVIAGLVNGDLRHPLRTRRAATRWRRAPASRFDRRAEPMIRQAIRRLLAAGE